MSAIAEPECPDCGGNCSPECGRHPLGCLYSGRVYGEWQIVPRCTLAHPDVARLLAEGLYGRMSLAIRVLKFPSDY